MLVASVVFVIVVIPAGVMVSLAFVPTSDAWFAILNVSLTELSIPTEKDSPPLTLKDVTGSAVIPVASRVTRASLPSPLTYRPPADVAMTCTGVVAVTVPTPTWDPT